MLKSIHDVRVNENSDHIPCSFTTRKIMVWYGMYEGWNFNSGNYLFTTGTK